MKAVLFVDDNQFLSRLSCEILSRHGYRAVPAYNAAQAFQALERDNFDLIVTDLRMEGGDDGLQLARKVTRRKPQVPVILVTAYGPVQDESIRACVAKEGLFPGLLDKIDGLLGRTVPEGNEKPGS